MSVDIARRVVTPRSRTGCSTVAASRSDDYFLRARRFAQKAFMRRETAARCAADILRRFRPRVCFDKDAVSGAAAFPCLIFAQRALCAAAIRARAAADRRRRRRTVGVASRCVVVRERSALIRRSSVPISVRSSSIRLFAPSWANWSSCASVSGTYPPRVDEAR
jgi:hypothetical protein